MLPSRGLLEVRPLILYIAAASLLALAGEAAAQNCLTDGTGALNAKLRGAESLSRVPLRAHSY